MSNFEHIINLLDFEIERLRIEHKQPGWTKWALIGALATSIWLLLSEFSINQFTWLNVATVFLLISIIFDSKLFLGTIFAQPNGTESGIRYEFSKSILRENSSVILIEFLRVCSLIVIISMLSMPNFYAVCLYIVYITIAFVFLFTFILSFFNIPIPMNQTGTLRKRLIINIIFLFFAGLAIFELFRLLWSQNPKLNISEIRLALLIFAIVTLLIFLAKEEKKSYLLPTLLNIRRNLILEKIDIESAKQQIDIALTGLRFADLLQKNIGDIISYLNESVLELEQICKEYEVVEKILDQDNQLNEQDETLVKAIESSIKNHLDKADKLTDMAVTSTDKMVRRIVFLQRLNPAISEEIEPIREKIKIAVGSVKDKIHQVSSKCKTVTTQIKQKKNTSK